MAIKTLKVSNVSLVATEQDIREFFLFSGDIQWVELQRESETSQVAYITFKESQGADTAMLLSGATIIDLAVSIALAEDYQLPPSAFPPQSVTTYPAAADSPVVKKAEDVVSSMLAKGFILGKDAINRAKAFDERHNLISNASATVASLDRKMGISEKLIIGMVVVNEKAREVDERYHVLEKTKSALMVAEQKATSAGSALMSNRYVAMGASWVSTALGMVVKAAEDVTMMTKEKVEKAEEDKKEIISRERTSMVNQYAQIHLDEDSQEITSREPSDVPVGSIEANKVGNI